MNEAQVKDIALRFLAAQMAQHESRFGASQFQYTLVYITRTMVLGIDKKL